MDVRHQSGGFPIGVTNKVIFFEKRGERVNFLDVLLIAQGAYFVATGVWPLVHIRSFLAVTGPKTDLWLVKTVGILIAVIGLSLLVSGVRQRATAEILFLAIGSQLALATVDVVYVAKKVIARIYLLDAAAELIFFAAFAACLTVSGAAR
jgi:hypothetical protein